MYETTFGDTQKRFFLPFLLLSQSCLCCRKKRPENQTCLGQLFVPAGSALILMNPIDLADGEFIIIKRELL